MINLIPTALTVFGREAVQARIKAGESASDIQLDAFDQRDATIKALFEAIESNLPKGTDCSEADHQLTVDVRNGEDMDAVLTKLNELVETHGQLFKKRGCSFQLVETFANVTMFELNYNRDHS
ncbi:MAG: hypothetical protein GY833_12790 [Aestuariibacter sp.]|nr:hypothetical protein [Aestuariibacter sp.]